MITSITEKEVRELFEEASLPDFVDGDGFVITAAGMRDLCSSWLAQAKVIEAVRLDIADGLLATAATKKELARLDAVSPDEGRDG